MHIAAKQPDQALNCFLQAKPLPPDAPAADAGPGQGSGEYRHVFELIEKEGMIDAIRDRVPQLVRLSRAFAGHLLVRHVEQVCPYMLYT